jgi:hypothetical protein
MSRRTTRLLIVLAGIVLGQFILYGASLTGRKVMLPLDLLARQDTYLPRTPEVEKIEPQNTVLSDLILLSEPSRRFAIAELRAGRLPTWAPYGYGGAPFVWPIFSPFLALTFCTESPIILAWVQLFAAMVAGLGAYLFFRRAVEVGYWPATVAAWCYPLTGFFVFWMGLPTSLSIYWFPWSLLAVDNVVRRTSALAPVGLAAITGLVLVSGHIDIAAQVLLSSGLYALWRLWNVWGNQCFQPAARRVALMLVLGWGLGFLLAAPHTLPLLDYARTGERMIGRGAGMEERPPVGLAVLPQTVLPDIYGSVQRGSYRYFDHNQLETTAAAYAGLLATLVVTPLAWCSRRHRAFTWLCLSAFFLGLSWCLNVPGIVQVLRLPGLNMLSHNRWVFMSSFAILTLAAVGLEVFLTGPVQWQWWLWLPPALLALLGAWCVYRIGFPPEPIASELELAVRQGQEFRSILNLEDVRHAQAWFARYHAFAAAWCGVGLGGWLLIWSRRTSQPRLFPVLAVLLVGDLLWFARGRTPQCDPSLFFPPIGVLQDVARSAPGRVLGYNCLPPSLASMCGLRDVRGYDSIDPARWVDLLTLVRAPKSLNFRYAETQWLVPKVRFSPEGQLRLSPILDMLGVRYLISRQAPPPGVQAAFHELDYWVTVNPKAMARVFVPRRVELTTNGAAQLLKMDSPGFDPREVAYVESPVDLPTSGQGTVEIVHEIPTRVTVSARMQSPGLVVLADLWDKGWHAYLDSKRVPILRTDHALRGVVVPAGTSTLVFRYEPASLRWGLALAGLAAATMLVWVIVARLRTPAATASTLGRPSGVPEASAGTRREATF